MSNAQVRLLASAIALLAGGIIANTSNINVNVSIAIILISSIIFIAEYWRLHKP
jgi:hypothetical protein